MAHSGVVGFFDAVLGVRVDTSTGCAFLFYRGNIMYDLTPQEFELLKNCLKKEAECCRMWDQAIKNHPKLAGHRKKFDELSLGEWAVILAYLPELAEFAPLKDLSLREWTYILACQPQLKNKYPGKLTEQQQADLRQVRDFIKRTSNN